MAKLKEAVSFLGSIAKMHVISHHLSKSPDTWYVNRQDLTWFFTRKQIGGRGKVVFINASEMVHRYVTYVNRNIYIVEHTYLIIVQRKSIIIIWARLVVFPIKGKNWCFSRSIDSSPSEFSAANTASTVKGIYKKISSNPKPLIDNAELLIDFVSNKMNKSWMGLEKAPEGSFKNKLHGLGLRLLARVKPSEILLKSITKDVTNVQITYPTSLNARLVQQRLRQIALRGTVIHRKYFYGSVSLLPLTTAFTVLPLPNIPFFWALFLTYSHWRGLQ
ncbi:uncharacterized protein LOC120217765 isoform X2 [Hibiscus syriacus]|uniref:uncharacterized protein LOC120217765 isoform X2 n=1 Tax=Hibiscus syriacus TaxID=106335 RepID=UPI001920E311|nr:uncharacterized protein LOC120217765 isoform X2 [Hibiscus syriacus]